MTDKNKQACSAQVAWDYAIMGLPNEEITEMWRACGHSGTVPFSFANRIQERMSALAAPADQLHVIPPPRGTGSQHEADFVADEKAERAAFEQWAEPRGYGMARTTDSYESKGTKSAWRGWFARARAIEAELASRGRAPTTKAEGK